MIRVVVMQMEVKVEGEVESDEKVVFKKKSEGSGRDLLKGGRGGRQSVEGQRWTGGTGWTGGHQATLAGLGR